MTRAAASSSPSDPSRAHPRAVRLPRHGPHARSANGLRVDRDADARPGAGLRVARDPGRRRATSPPRAAARPCSPPAALTEGTEVRDAIALTEAAERLGRVAPRRGRLGRDVRRPGRPGEPPRARARAARRGRPAPGVPGAARWTGCATSASPTCSRRRPTRGGAPTRRTSTTIYAPSSPYHRPAGGQRRHGRDAHRGRARAVHERNVDPGPRRDRRRGRRRPGRRDRHGRAACSATGREARRPSRRVRSTTRPRIDRPVRPRRPPAGRRADRDPRRATRRCRAATRTSTRCP